MTKIATSIIAIDANANRHFQMSGPGTLVANKDALFQTLENAEKVAPEIGGKEGQMMISVPTELVSGAFTLIESVSPEDIQASIKRGRIETFVSREKYVAVPVTSANVILYSKAAYAQDPDVLKDIEGGKIEQTVLDSDYVIVAVLANVTDKDPQSLAGFVHNLAGGNKRYSVELGYTIEKAIAEAKAVEEFSERYIKLG